MYTVLKGENVRRGSVDGAAWLSLWCGVAQLMVRRGSVGSTLACCKAGPSSILGSAPQVFPTELTSDEEMERGLGEWRWMYCMNVIE